MEVEKEEIVSNSEVIKILEERASQKELNYIQKNILETLKKFEVLDLKKVEKLKNELKKIEKLKERHIIAIINFLPKDKDELKAVLYKDYSLLNQDEIERIINLVKSI